jgi:putative tricarboxylic transport membrane protein
LRGVGAVAKRLPPAAGKLTREDWRQCLPTILRAAPVGVFIGAVPGLGAAISAFVNYGMARNFSRQPDKFGHGSIEGVAAAECGANSVCSSTFIPLLTLGIPGDTITAIMLGAFMVHGLVPGPALFAEHMDFVTAFFVAMAVCTLMHLVIGRAGLPLFMQAVKIPTQLLFPIVVVLCATGVYVSSNSYFDMVVMLAFGVLGYGMKKFNFPVAPLLIGFILGPIVEVGLRQSLIVSHGSVSIFFERPVSLGCLVLAVAVIVWVAIKEIRKRRVAA